MAIHITRVYTRTGDDGTTALGDGTRVPKSDPRLDAFADCDETNAAIGVVLALAAVPADVADVLAAVQNDLFDVGADLCTPVTPGEADGERLRIGEADIARLEAACDTFNDRLGKLTSFILPGGSPAAALLHTARTIARRAERNTWRAVELDADHTVNPLAARYLNRLSDLLFVLARAVNDPAVGGAGDVLWQPAASR